MLAAGALRTGDWSLKQHTAVDDTVGVILDAEVTTGQRIVQLKLGAGDRAHAICRPIHRPTDPVALPQQRPVAQPDLVRRERERKQPPHPVKSWLPTNPQNLYHHNGGTIE